MVLAPVVLKVSLQLPFPVAAATVPEQTSPVLAVRTTAPIGLYEVTLKSRTAVASPSRFIVTVGLGEVIAVVVAVWSTWSTTSAVVMA